jgi:hypothetical protein
MPWKRQNCPRGQGYQLKRSQTEIRCETFEVSQHVGSLLRSVLSPLAIPGSVDKHTISPVQRTRLARGGVKHRIYQRSRSSESGTLRKLRKYTAFLNMQEWYRCLWGTNPTQVGKHKSDDRRNSYVRHTQAR